ncbi:MAG: hypothetical protein JRE40_07635 [Deltaproteobacteria bacterium]|nr:hypothetical protein [Deltaproteobacteria bacterium]
MDREIKRLDEALDPRRGAARSVFEEILGEVKGRGELSEEERERIARRILERARKQL